MSRVVKKPDERKEELLDIATKLFVEKGYENTSVKDIYSQANGSFGMFYHHFKSKEEVLEEANKRMKQKLFDEIRSIMLNEDSTGIEKLKKIILVSIESSKQGAIENRVPPFCKNPQLLLLHMQDTLCVSSEFISHIIADGIKDGTIQTTQPLELSRMIALFINVWLNPWIYKWSNEELHNNFIFIKTLLDKVNVSVFTDETYRALKELYAAIEKTQKDNIKEL